GRGLGRSLLRAAVDAAGRAGHHRCLLHALDDNAPALRLYRSAGFQPVGAAFPHATVVVTEPMRRTMADPTLRAGVLKGLLPAGLEPRLQAVPDRAFRIDATTGLRTADLFGDGTYRLVDLPGHADGHVGALVDG
ncbi:GNAT family N-acetyltransferase, partial [Bacillus sp. S34]|nr:GNAT family N-acetyltransferase [Bacillus sp. S34]